MTCDDVRDRWVELLTEQGPPEPSAWVARVDTSSPGGDPLVIADPEVLAHVASCSACRDEVQAIRALVTRVRSALAPVTAASAHEAPTHADTVAPPPLEDVLEAVRARARPRRAARLLVHAAGLLAAALLGVTVDRALTRAQPPLAPTPTVRPSAPSAPSAQPPSAASSSLREALAEHPGGLAASLALLDAMSSGAVGPR